MRVKDFFESWKIQKILKWKIASENRVSFKNFRNFSSKTSFTSTMFYFRVHPITEFCPIWRNSSSMVLDGIWRLSTRSMPVKKSVIIGNYRKYLENTPIYRQFFGNEYDWCDFNRFKSVPNLENLFSMCFEYIFNIGCSNYR